MPELRRMLEETRDKALEEVEDFYGVGDVPEFTLTVQIQMPKITEQNTQQFSKWNWRQNNLCKTLHVITEAGKVHYMHQELFTYAKIWVF